MDMVNVYQSMMKDQYVYEDARRQKELELYHYVL